MSKFFFFQAILGIGLCQETTVNNDKYSKPLSSIRQEFGQGIRNATKTAGQSISSSIDALIKAFLTISQAEIDIIRTLVDKQTTAVEKFINIKLEKIDNIRDRFRNMINQRLDGIAETGETVAVDETAIAAGLAELNALQEEMKNFLDKLKNRSKKPII